MIKLITASFATNIGRFTLDLMEDDGTDTVTGTPSEVEIQSSPTAHIGKRSLGYGVTVLPMSVELTIGEGGELVREIIGDGFDEMQYLAQITGPNFDWMGRINSGSRSRPVGVRSYPGQVDLALYDVLAGLDQLTPKSMEIQTVSYTIADACLRAVPYIPVYFYLDAYPVGVESREPHKIRWAGEPFGDGQGDYGKVREQLERAAAAVGLVVYQSTTDASWRAIHRAAIGEAITDATRILAEINDGYTGNQFIATVDLDADTVDVVDDDVRTQPDDEFVELPAAGRVTLTGQGGDNLVGPDGQSLQVDSDPDTARPQTESVESIAVTPEAGVYVRLRFGFDPRWDVTPPTGEGDVTLTATVYSRANDGTDTQILQHVATATEQGNPTYQREETSASDLATLLSASGQLRVEFVDSSNSYDVGGGGDPIVTYWPWVQIDDVRLQFVDSNGDLITDWTVSVEGRPGVTVEVERAPALQYFDGSAWQDAQEIDSTLFGTFTSLPSYQATNRLKQQAPELENLEGGLLNGLHGPGRRLRIDKFEDGTVKPFLMVGAELRFQEALTAGVWVELPDTLGGA